MEQEFGLKELYDVSIKATYSMEINGRTIEPGEIVAAFDKIQISSFDEQKRTFTAHGGYDGRSLIYWSDTRELNFTLIQGIFSKTQFALMTNAKLVNTSTTPTLISRRESLESNNAGLVTTKYNITQPLYVYNKATGARITPTNIETNHFTIPSPFVDVIVDYQYNYTSSTTTLYVGHELISGFLQLEGKTRVKDDITGQTKTGILRIPKLRLTSDLSMRLGKDGSPITGRLDGVAFPTGTRGNEKVMEIIFLDDDIDSDF